MKHVHHVCNKRKGSFPEEDGATILDVLSYLRDFNVDGETLQKDILEKFTSLKRSPPQQFLQDYPYTPAEQRSHKERLKRLVHNWQARDTEAKSRSSAYPEAVWSTMAPELRISWRTLKSWDTSEHDLRVKIVSVPFVLHLDVCLELDTATVPMIRKHTFSWLSADRYSKNCSADISPKASLSQGVHSQDDGFKPVNYCSCIRVLKKQLIL